MRLLFLKPDLKEKNSVLIGRTGVIRFSKDFANKHKFIKNENWLLGLDEDEKINKHIYIFRAKDRIDGYKMKLIGGNWSLNGSAILANTNIKVPFKCKVAPIELNNYEGFVLSFP